MFYDKNMPELRPWLAIVPYFFNESVVGKCRAEYIFDSKCRFPLAPVELKRFFQAIHFDLLKRN